MFRVTSGCVMQSVRDFLFAACQIRVARNSSVAGGTLIGIFHQVSMQRVLALG